MHHYGYVALYEASILQKGRFRAASLDSSSSMSNEVRSPLIFSSQVEHGRPGGLLQSPVGLKEYSVRIRLPINLAHRTRQTNLIEITSQRAINNRKKNIAHHVTVNLWP